MAFHRKSFNKFKAVQSHISTIAGKALTDIPEHEVTHVINLAHRVKNAYDKKIGQKKAKEGSFEGAITTAVSIATFGVVKRYTDLDNTMENVLAGSIATISGAVVHAAMKFLSNYLRHK